ncbi:MAG: pseudouridine synthase [Bacteroides sp.]|nr:pseudouridine synthase [Ruminococcus flavefaciens]MCM1555410.1 pseudouridine synthase [Bacteroides sp.]
MIESGVILVNGEVCTVLGTLVGPNDKVQFGGQTLNAEKKVYLLMNKPKGYITTSEDPQDRKTVMELVADACRERIYPVGRLDRNTTGVLLFTNDGDIAKNLTHPSHGARKIYHVTLDRPLAKSDLSVIAKGVMLEDGLTEVDEISYVEEGDRKEVGIQLHSGKNRIVRRIFEHFGYEVTKLDRVLFAELTKKDLKRGQWRFLTEQEINFLKVNAGGKAMTKRTTVEKKEVFTAEQLAEAEALAEAEEAPVKKRTTRKKAEAVEPESEEAPVKKRATRKKAEAAEPESEEVPVKKRATRKKAEVAEPESEEAPVKKRATRKKAEVAEPEMEEAPVKKRTTRKKAEVAEPESEEAPVKKRATRKKAEVAEPESEEAPVKKRATRKKTEAAEPEAEKAPAKKRTTRKKAE